MKYLHVILLVVATCFSAQLLADNGHENHSHENHPHENADYSHDKHEDQDEHEQHDKHEVEDDGDSHGHGEHDEHAEESRLWTSEMLATHQVVLATAGSAALQQRQRLYGSIVLSPQGVSHVRARYPGLIRSVHVNIGDEVKQGDKLATVESNDSLRTYTINAALSGTVIERHANTGEATQDQILFSIAELNNQWLELKVYPSQFGLIRAEQVVRFRLNRQSFETTIRYLLPVVGQPYQLARAELSNSLSNLDSMVGSYIEAYADTGEFSVDVAVAQQAIQTMDGKQGVFVAVAETQNQLRFEFRPLVLGRRDSQSVEVLQGLSQGTRYVRQNSYLIKADAEKAEAEHAH